MWAWGLWSLTTLCGAATLPAELSRRPAVLLSAQLDARARQCGLPPAPSFVRSSARSTHAVERAGQVLAVAVRRTPSLLVTSVHPPICAEEPKDDGEQVLPASTQLVQDTLRWLEEEVNARRGQHCPGEPPVALEVRHVTLKVTAGFLVGCVLSARAASPPPPASLPKAAREAVPRETRGGPSFHRVEVSWEYANLQTVARALATGSGNESRFLVPSATLPAAACALLERSTFELGTLGTTLLERRGYLGFEPGHEHVDLIPAEPPRALRFAVRTTHLRGLRQDCPRVCPEGYSRYFADIFFAGGADSCYRDCGCADEANYATVCDRCCRADPSGCSAVEAEERCADVPSLPAALDLRSHETCFPPTVVEDQGMCGSCFAFATLGAIADRLCLQSPRTLVDAAGYRHMLSVQQFLSCNVPVEDADFPGLAPEQYGCGGGYFLAAARFLVKQGIALQDHYPYSSKCLMEGGVVNDGVQTFLGPQERTCDTVAAWIPRDLLPCACQGHTSERKCLDREAPITIQGVYRLPNSFDISPHTGTYYTNADVEAMMKLDLMTEGSLYAAMRIFEDFDSFFFTDPTGVYAHRYGRQVGGHAIVLVGWGQQGGVPYWLIRNSWGLNWGDSGHFRVRRGVDECGIEARVWGARLKAALQHTPEPLNPWTMYGYYPEQTFAGSALRTVEAQSLAQLKEACKFEPQCAGFDSSGVLKRAVPHGVAWAPLHAPLAFGDRDGASKGGFYTKLQREKVLIDTWTADGDAAGTLGPLEVFLCGPADCASVPVELAGLRPGKQRFEKDAWLPLGFALHSLQLHNRNARDPWVPAGPVRVQLPEHPGSPRVVSQTFAMTGSFGPESAPWQSVAAALALLVFT